MEPAAIGRYQVVRRLGGGAMGQVYLATDSLLGRQVAVKLMRPHTEEGPERFTLEARTVAALSHPNVVVLHDFGVADEQPYLVMEHLEGESLDHWLATPRSARDQLVVLRGLCRAVRYAHGRGVLHRDIKPSNVQVLPDGESKLMDFGIALAGTTRMTATGIVLGTPEFLAPELLAGQPCSPASDAYAVAVLAYQVFAGINPFTADTVAACLKRVSEETPADLAVRRPDLPPALTRTIMAYLAKVPAARPDGLDPLLLAVDAALDALEKPAGSTASSAATTRLVPAPPPPVPPPAATGTSSRRWVALAVTALAGVILVVLWLTRPGDGEARPAPLGAGTGSTLQRADAAADAAPPADLPAQSDDRPAPVMPLRAPPQTETTTPGPPASEPPPVDTAASGQRVPPAAQRARQQPPATATAPAEATSGEPAVTTPATPPRAAVSSQPASDTPTVLSAGPPPGSTAPPVADPTASTVAPASTAADTAQPAATPPSVRLLQVTPDALRRGSGPTLRLRGENLPPAPHVELRRGRRPAQGVTVLATRRVGDDELSIQLLIDDDAPLGAVQLLVLDADGHASNPLVLEIEL